jgi:hypothetical protein
VSLQLFDRKYHPTWESCSGGGALASQRPQPRRLSCALYVQTKPKTEQLEMLFCGMGFVAN